MIQTDRVMNHNYTRPEEVKIVDEQDDGPRRFTATDENLLDRIARREIICLPSNDKRLLYRISDAECDMILKIREGELHVAPPGP